MITSLHLCQTTPGFENNERSPLQKQRTMSNLHMLKMNYL